MLNNKNYHSPQTRAATNGGNLKQNLYSPKPESLKHGYINGKTEILLSDGKSRIFVTPGHNIEKAVARYENALKFRLVTESRHDGNKKEIDE